MPNKQLPVSKLISRLPTGTQSGTCPLGMIPTGHWFFFPKEGLQRYLSMALSFQKLCSKERQLMRGMAGPVFLISSSSFLPALSERPEECGPLCSQLSALWPRWQGHAAEPGVLPVPQGQVGPLGRAFPAQTRKGHCMRREVSVPFILTFRSLLCTLTEVISEMKGSSFFPVFFCLLTFHCFILISKSVKTTESKHYGNILLREISS